MAEFSENDDLILSFWKLPSAKDEKVRPYCCTWVTISSSRRCSNWFALFPTHIICVPYHEIVTVIWSSLMSCSISWMLSPSSKHDYIRCWNVESMAISSLGRCPWNSESRPYKSFSLEYFDVIVIRVSKDRSLFQVCLSKHFFSMLVTSMND